MSDSPSGRVARTIWPLALREPRFNERLDGRVDARLVVALHDVADVHPLAGERGKLAVDIDHAPPARGANMSMKNSRSERSRGAKKSMHSAGSAIAAGAARLLVVRLQRVRHVVVEHHAHIRLIDAHAEGVRRHDDSQAVARERILDSLAVGIFHARVIARALDALLLQVVGELLDAACGCRSK